MLRTGVICLVISAAAQASLIAPIPIGKLAEAPFIVVARVESTQPGPLVTAGAAADSHTHRSSAVLRILRSMPEFPGSQIQLNYFSTTSGSSNGHPTYPNLEAGISSVFAVVPDGSNWKLVVEEGFGSLVPAIESTPDGGALATKRDFILRELLNAIEHGSYTDLYRFSAFLQFRSPEELNNAIFAALKARLAPGDRRWLDLSTALLGTMGMPRQKLDDFIASNGKGRALLFGPDNLAARTLREVPEPQRREGIVRNMLRYSAIHPWGSAVTLSSDFKDDPLLLQLLPGYLERNQKGAVDIACWLINSGQMTLLDPARNAALHVVMDHTADYSEINLASRLILEHGTDAQFDQFIGVIKDAKARDVARYSQLWQVVFGGKQPRVIRILAVLMDDERPAAPGMSFRFCDYAASQLQIFSGESFGFKPGVDQSLTERNAAVARARNWLKSH